jgi:hypothetical protein
MSSHCCPACFDDPGLTQDLIPSRSTGCGNCDYCGTNNDVPLVEPQALAPEFQTIISIYESDPAGRTLVEWLKDDWKLFSHPKMDVANAMRLLGDILDDGQIVRRPFSPSDTYKSVGLTQWATLRDELMTKNRYFLDQALDRDRLEQLLGHLAIEIPAGDVWHRARILNQATPFVIGEMGAPPARLASHGRANPPGIPYLYLGSQPDTAISETRPHTGEVACIADFTITDRLNAVDLCAPRHRVSPFRLADATAIGQLRADIPLLEHLGEELTRPVLPSGAAIDYIPSQYLCEFIKKCGFAGVLYRSSVSTGRNLALFNPVQAQGGSVAMYDVASVTVRILPKHT